MTDFWLNLSLEIIFLTLLGVIYYIYQKRKLLRYEADRPVRLMEIILNACLDVRGDSPNQNLDPIIEAIDDFLQQRLVLPPTDALIKYAASSDCDPDLKLIITQALDELTKS